MRIGRRLLPRWRHLHIDWRVLHQRRDCLSRFPRKMLSQRTNMYSSKRSRNLLSCRRYRRRHPARCLPLPRRRSYDRNYHCKAHRQCSTHGSGPRSISRVKPIPLRTSRQWHLGKHFVYGSYHITMWLFELRYYNFNHIFCTKVWSIKFWIARHDHCNRILRTLGAASPMTPYLL